MAELERALHFNPSYLEFIFIPNHPAMIDAHHAADLLKKIPSHIKTVGVVHNAEEDWLEHLLSTVPLDIIHLTGSETLEDITYIKQQHHVMVMKSFFYTGAKSLKDIERYLPLLDYAQLSGQAPPNVIPAFGYSYDCYAIPPELLDRLRLPIPWFLAGKIEAHEIKEYEKYKNIKRLSLSIV